MWYIRWTEKCGYIPLILSELIFAIFSRWRHHAFEHLTSMHKLSLVLTEFQDLASCWAESDVVTLLKTKFTGLGLVIVGCLSDCVPCNFFQPRCFLLLNRGGFTVLVQHFLQLFSVTRLQEVKMKHILVQWFVASAFLIASEDTSLWLANWIKMTQGSLLFPA